MGFFRQEYMGFQARKRVPICFSGGSGQPRYWTLVFCSSCMAGRFLTTEPSGKPLISCMVVVVGGNSVATSCLTLVTPWTIACQDPLSMGFSRQEYWSGLPLPSPGKLPDPRTEPRSPALQADSSLTESPTREAQNVKEIYPPKSVGILVPKPKL